MRKLKILLISLILTLTSCHTAIRYGKQTLIDKEGIKLLTVHINSKSAILLLDSGAKTTVLDESFCKDISLEYYGSEESIVGIGGESKLFMSFPYKLKILGDTITYSSSVGDLSHVIRAFRRSGIEIKGILGADFLKYNGCIINYRTNTLECGNETRKKDSNPLH